MTSIQSISHIKTNSKVLELILPDLLQGKTLLDVGAGEGYFLQSAGNTIQQQRSTPLHEQLFACDIHPAEFNYDKIQCQQANFHRPLPYADDRFDTVVSIEVIEHLEDQFHFVRELYRITKPGGKVIITTPNILNINSRIRHFFSGFGLLFDILPLHRIEPTRLSGHIHPISFYYLAYAMYRAKFQRLEAYFDRIKKSGLFLSLLFYPLIQAGFILYKIKTIHKKKELFAENHHLMGQVNRLSLLASRTLIVVGYK